MAGTRIGGLKAKAVNIEHFGSNFYRMIGYIGGQSKHPLKGFGSDHGLARVAGAKGGNISKRTKKEAL